MALRPSRSPRAWLATALLLAAGLAGCVDPGSNAARADECLREDWTRTAAEDGDVSICHPPDWEQGGEHSAFDGELFLTTENPATATPPVANLNVLEEPVPERVDFDGYVQASLETLRAIVTDLDIESSERLGDDPPTHALVYEGRQGQFQLQWHQRLVDADDTAYVVTFTKGADATEPDRATIEDVLASFQAR